MFYLKKILSYKYLIYLVIPFIVALFFGACIKRIEKNLPIADENNRLISQARSYFETEISPSAIIKPVTLDNGGIIGNEKLPLWDLAKVQNLPFCSQTVVVPILAPNQYVSHSGKKLPVSFSSFLIIYKDKDQKQRAEVVLKIPDENSTNENFSGIALVKDWNDKPLWSFAYENSKEVSLKLNSNVKTPIHTEIAAPTYVCYDIDFYTCVSAGEMSFPCTYNYTESHCVLVSSGGGGGGSGGSSGGGVGGVGGGGGGGSGGSGGGTVNIPPSDSLKKIAKIVNMSPDAKAALNTSLDYMLKRSCQARAFFSYLTSKGVKLSFTTDASSNIQGYYDSKTKTIVFQNDGTISPDVLQEELYHAFQNSFYGTMPTTIGRSNIEFEAKFFRDLILVRNAKPCCFTVTLTQADSQAYFAWLVAITNNGSTYPNNFANLRDKYFYFLEKFKASWPEYNTPTDPNFNPTALFNLFSTNDCP